MASPSFRLGREGTLPSRPSRSPAQAEMADSREVAIPCPAAAGSVNMVRSAYSPFLPMLKDWTGRK